jgi:hypothetical protein
MSFSGSSAGINPEEEEDKEVVEIFFYLYYYECAEIISNVRHTD